ADTRTTILGYGPDPPGGRKTMLRSVDKTHPSAHARVLGALFILLLAFFASGRTAVAQATASVRGTVTDPSGSAVVGATVAIANPESKTERTTTTGAQGEYQFLF